jgi:hypothetical protein
MILDERGSILVARSAQMEADAFRALVFRRS